MTKQLEERYVFLLAFKKQHEAKAIKNILIQNKFDVVLSGDESNSIPGVLAHTPKIPLALYVDSDQHTEAQNFLIMYFQQKSQEEASSLTKKSNLGLIAAFFVTTMFFAFVVPYINGKYECVENADYNKDFNEDGLTDSTVDYHSNGLIKKALQDYDFDGNFDAIQVYEKGMIVSHIQDENFDGKDDLWILYKNGIPAEYQADNDGDGVKDEKGIYEGHAVKLRFWSYKNDSIFDKKIEYKFGRMLKKEIDTNRDGVYDTVEFYDSFERPINHKKN